MILFILFILSLSFFIHAYMLIFVKKPCLKCYKHMNAMLQIVVLENYTNFLLLVLFFPFIFYFYLFILFLLLTIYIAKILCNICT